MKSQRLMLTPLMMWSTQVFHVGRKEGLSDAEITQCVRIYSKERGWQNWQVNKVLRYQGILKPLKPANPLRIICPKCDCVGRLNSYHQTYNQKIAYYIAHENLKEMWGNPDHHQKKYRRCYLYDLMNCPQYLKPIANQLFPIAED